eukprot:6740962-Heterocapsa_arctica.AAC.1
MSPLGRPSIRNAMWKMSTANHACRPTLLRTVRTISSLQCRVHRSSELFLRTAPLILVHPYDMREEFKH